MSSILKTMIFGEASECAAAIELLAGLPRVSEQAHEFRQVSDQDDFQALLQQWRPGLTIVLANGAAGLEGVYAVKRHHPESPVFWFSNDHEFGMMSHRLECAYFAVKPVTQEKFRRAFRRCDHIGVHFE